MQEEVPLAVEQDGLPKSAPSMDVAIADIVTGLNHSSVPQAVPIVNLKDGNEKSLLGINWFKDEGIQYCSKTWTLALKNGLAQGIKLQWMTKMK